MNPHEQHPELYDLPGDLRPRRIYRAGGSRLTSPKGAKKRYRHDTSYINAPTLQIATRAATNHFKLFRMKLDFIHEITWEEYAIILQRSGFTIHLPAKKSSAA